VASRTINAAVPAAQAGADDRFELTPNCWRRPTGVPSGSALTISTYRFTGDNPDRLPASDQDLVEFARASNVGIHSMVIDWE
jgi:hypothetical protein